MDEEEDQRLRQAIAFFEWIDWQEARMEEELKNERGREAAEERSSTKHQERLGRRRRRQHVEKKAHQKRRQERDAKFEIK